jgi:periplasmic divalent cation tolerance protein
VRLARNGVVTDCIAVLVTVGSPEEGERISDTLVNEQLAACVNRIGPIRSVYRWENAVHHDDEYLLIIKTRGTLFDSVRTRVQALHSYRTPEVIALPISAGADAYLDWLRDATRAPEKK